MLNLTNSTGIPLPLFEEMSKMYSSHPKMDNNHFSATEFNKSIKEIVFNRRHDDRVIDVDIQLRLKAIRGTWFHEAMEKRLKERWDCICEKRFCMPIVIDTDIGPQEKIISGGIDCLWLDDNNDYHILDWKNSNQTKIDKESVEEDSDWKRQMNIYATLVEYNLGYRPKDAIMVCFDDSKRAGELNLDDPKSLICQYFTIDLMDREYEKKLFDDIKKRLSEITQCLDFGYALPECNEVETWMTEKKYDISKTGNPWRTKQSLEDAVEFIATIKTKKEEYKIFEQPRCPKKCLKYCDHKHYCEQGMALIKAYEENKVKVYDYQGNEIKEMNDEKVE